MCDPRVNEVGPSCCVIPLANKTKKLLHRWPAKQHLPKHWQHYVFEY